jgi:hypothetical protein
VVFNVSHLSRARRQPRRGADGGLARVGHRRVPR